MRDICVEMFGRMLRWLADTPAAQTVWVAVLALGIAIGSHAGSFWASAASGMLAFVGGMVLGCAFAVSAFVDRRN